MTEQDDHGDGIVAGWKLFARWADAALPKPRRRRLWGLGSGVSVVVSLLASLALTLSGGASGIENALLALCIGIAAGSVTSTLLVWWSMRQRRGTPRQPRKPRYASAQFSGLGLAYGTEWKIRDAWLTQREPGVKLEQRLAAAESARRTRRFVPGYIFVNMCLAPFWFASIGAIVTFEVAESPELITLWIFPFYAVLNIGSTIGFLHTLGRTRAPIETAPDVPDHLEPDGRKRPTPRKLLGTDHADDYS